jgi:hypothetical protein
VTDGNPSAIALSYAARGWPVFPCHSILRDSCTCGKAECQSPGKHPRTANGFRDASSDPATIAAWWRQWPTANIGIPTGRATFVALDIDVEPGGDDSLRDLEAKHGPLPETVTVLTGSGGRHLLFAHPGQTIQNAEALAGYPGLDIRGDGGYVIASGSRHISGRPYVFEVGHEPDNMGLAEFPAWLLDLATRRNGSRPAGDASKKPPLKLVQGQRNSQLTKIAGSLRRIGTPPEGVEAALLALNATLATPPLPETEVREIAASAKRWQPAVEWQAVKAWSFLEIMQTDFPEIVWLAERLVPDSSLVFLAGRKKLGKSYMALQLAIAIASGALFLRRPTTQGSILYFDLEGGERRVKWRLKQMQVGATPYPIEFVFKMRHLDADGLADLESMIATKRPKVVIIDTWRRAINPKLDENSAEVADTLYALADLCRAYGASIILIGHHGKAGRGDAGHDIRGSSAIGAASDLTMGLYKEDDRYLLVTEGRDIEGEQLAIAFDRQTWAWQLIGDARLLAKAGVESDIARVLKEFKEADANAIARELGKTRQAVQDVLKRMVANDKVTRRSEKQRILYRLAETG